MNEELKIINEQEVLGKDFKIYGSIDEPLFLAKDVADWIEYDKSSINKMLNKVDEDEKVRNIVPTLGGAQEICKKRSQEFPKPQEVGSNTDCCLTI